MAEEVFAEALLVNLREMEAPFARLKTLAPALRDIDAALTALGQPCRNRTMRRLRDNDLNSVLVALRDLIGRVEKVIALHGATGAVQ